MNEKTSQQHGDVFLCVVKDKSIYKSGIDRIKRYCLLGEFMWKVKL